MEIKTVGLVGLGRFGKMAYRYLPQGSQLRVYDSDPTKLEGIAEAASFQEVVGSQLLLLCIPISAIEPTCREMAPHLKSGQVVVDTCSVKEAPLRSMLTLLPDDVEVLGTHPLFGPDSGRHGIAGLKIALCPARIRPETYQTIRDYLETQRLIVVETTPEDHDRCIAQSQAIFHLIARAIKQLGWGGHSISTPGPTTFYHLVDSVQHDTDQLFLDLERENPYAEECRRQFIERLDLVHKELSNAVLPSERSR